MVDADAHHTVKAGQLVLPVFSHRFYLAPQDCKIYLAMIRPRIMFLPIGSRFYIKRIRRVEIKSMSVVGQDFKGFKRNSSITLNHFALWMPLA
nr:hypothetical transcript [Hymenolepis microstoma]